MKSILLVAPNVLTNGPLESFFPPEYLVKKADNRASALKILEKKRYDLVFVDLSALSEGVQENDIKTALQSFWNIYPLIQIIVITYKEKIRDAVTAVKAGAYNYLTYPLEPNEINHVIEEISEYLILKSELDYLRDVFWKEDEHDIVKTNNDSMKEVFRKIRFVSPTKTTVLLVGETGTGKSILAKTIHRHSNRENAQFISVHCGAIPDSLLESELFGHEKGAFTGAVRRKLGKFEIAKGGSIFLDEIGTISPSAQIKLLQVLQDGTFSRLGSEDSIETNARVIAATNTDLQKMVEEGLFRKDLFYRLNVFPILIPPLRERLEDIPFFVEFFLKRLNRELQKDIRRIHPHVLNAFGNYSWPGNIRELENLIERACILENSSILTPESFPNEIFQKENASKELMVSAVLPIVEARRMVIEDFECQYIKTLLSRNKGKIYKSAEEAGISTRQLNKLMLKYGVRKEKYKA
jgi:DNA-binding NtrC family response regulator